MDKQTASSTEGEPARDDIPGAFTRDMDQTMITDLLDLYAAIDRNCLSFCLATGLRCLENCGECCTSIKVEARPMELLPAAAELAKRGELENWYVRLSNGLDDQGVCVFYTSEPVLGGHCQMYAWRPVMCRLFNFAVFTRKDGKGIFGACRPLQRKFPELVTAVQEKIAANLEAPRLSQYAIQIFGKDGSCGGGLMPINQALRLAIERYGLRLELLWKERADRFEPSIHSGAPAQLAAA